MCEGCVLGCLIDDLTGHAGVDYDVPSLVLAVDPEFGRSAGGIKDSKDINAVDVIEVILGQFNGRLDDRDTGVLAAAPTHKSAMNAKQTP